MNDAAFRHAQAVYDAAEPNDELAPPERVERILDDLVSHLDEFDVIEDGREVHRLGDCQATVAIWIDGHEYSLTLNRED